MREVFLKRIFIFYLVAYLKNLDPLNIMSGPTDFPVIEEVEGLPTTLTSPPAGVTSEAAGGEPSGGQGGGSDTPPLPGARAEAVTAGGPLRPAMRPPPDVVDDIKAKGGGLNLIFSYCLVPQEIGQRFMAAAGFSDSDHFSVAAGVSHSDVDEVIRDIVALHGPISLSNKAKLRISFQVARAIQGIEEAPLPSAPPPAPAVTVTQPMTGQPQPSQITFPAEMVWRKAPETDIISLKETVWQDSKAEAKLLPTGPGSEVKAGYARYAKQEGDYPSEDEDITIEQLSAFKMILSHYISLYVDLALWVPFWKRFMKMKRFMGRVVDEHGTQQIVEILGPPTIEAWETCFNCFTTACNIFNVTD